MFKRLTLLFICFLTPALAQAQDEIVKDITVDRIEKFINDDLKVRVLRKGPSAQGGIYFRTPDSDFDIEFRERPQKVLVFQYVYSPQSRKATNEQLNEWNQRKGNAARASRLQGSIMLSGTVSLEAGVSFAKLKTYYGQIQQERRDFEQFLNIGGKLAPLPPIVTKSDDIVRQAFPAKATEDKQKTSWEIEWELAPNQHKKVSLLRIASARFNFKDNAGQPRSVVVARNIELAEAFAHYDDKITAFLDLALPGRANRTVVATPKLQGPNCVAPTEILPYSKNPKLTIFREVHDDGIRWLKGYGPSGSGENPGYRGEKLVLSSIFQAVNYVYVMEYQFTDDGRIVCRLGFTAHNYYHRGVGENKVPEGDVHLHVGCWRMDFDLGDQANNKYFLVQRYFDKQAQRFRVGETLFNNGTEGSALWEAEKFTTLRVVSGALKSRPGTTGERAVAYDLIPSRLGSVRGLLGQMDVQNENMDFLNRDFWITHRPDQGLPSPYHKVPGYAKQRPLVGQPTTVWYSAPALHVPRGEDFGPDGRTKGSGVALTTWIEFTLRPRDLFDSTPLYQ